MKRNNIYNQFTTSPIGTKLAVLAVAAAWGLLFVIVAVWAFLYFETPGQAQEVTPVADTPVIALEPLTGSAGTEVTVQGEGWPANTPVSIFLVESDETDIPEEAVANVVSDSEGQFTAQFTFPEESRWDDQNIAVIVAQTEGGEMVTLANLGLINELEETPAVVDTPTGTPVVIDTPIEAPAVIDTPTETPVPTAVVTTVAEDSDTLPLPETSIPTETSAPLPTATAAVPGLTSTVNLNVRSGPGTLYPEIGLLQPGQSAEVTGLSYDGGWWQIAFAGGYGWVSAPYVTAQNVSNVPLVQAAPPPATPTPTPAPVPVAPAAPPVGTWRAEYYDNLFLSGAPVVVRNEGAINYNWGQGAPVAGLGADNFSARWIGSWPFSEGAHRFHARVDDGVRVYVDDVLVIDSWQDGGQRELVGERWLTGGYHTIRVEYYENQVYSVMQYWSDPVAPPPPPPASQNPDDDDDDGDDEPEADFSVNRSSGSAPLRVEFDNDSDGDYDDCDWDFGDGESSDDCDDVEHTYDDPGTYTVWLRVEGPDGSDTEQKSDYIRVGEPDDDDGGEPNPPVNWHSVIPSDWRSQVPSEYHGAIAACLDHFNRIQRPVESPIDLDDILEDCANYLD